MSKLELQLVSKFQNAENRKREAVRAAHDQDEKTLLELLNHYLTLKSSRKADTSADTRRLYELAVRRFLEFSNTDGARLELTRLEAEDVEFWMVNLQQEGLTPGTIAAYLYGLRAMYRALIWAKAASSNPAGEVRPPKDPTPAHSRKNALSPALYRDLLEAPAAKYGVEDSRRARDVLLLALGGSAGLRAMEIVSLDVTDIEMGVRRLTVRSGKGGKKRFIPLSKNISVLLKSWLEVRQGMVLRSEILESETALLVSVSRNASSGKRLTTDGARFIAKGYYKSLGIPSQMWGLHTLRRTAGTHLYRATRDLHVVADVLGHASVNTSAIYAKMDMDVRREALEAMETMRDQADKG